MKLGKWIGGGLGWAFFGPIGGLFGFALGSILDVDVKVYKQQPNNTTQGDFMLSLIVLVAAVMKADGKILRSELNYVKQFLIANFGKDTAAEALKLLKDILNQDIPIDEVAVQIKQNLDYSSRLQLIHFLYGVAQADGEVHKSELDIILEIGRNMGISTEDMNSIHAMSGNSVDSAYEVLEVEKSVSNEEVKKAYRRLAQMHHPDRVSYLGEEIQKSAKEKFQKINEAYERIKKERGMV